MSMNEIWASFTWNFIHLCRRKNIVCCQIILNKSLLKDIIIKYTVRFYVNIYYDKVLGGLGGLFV